MNVLIMTRNKKNNKKKQPKMIIIIVMLRVYLFIFMAENCSPLLLE